METHNNLKYSRNEIYAYEIGYRVTEDGFLQSPSGKYIGSINSSGYIKFSIQNKRKRYAILAHRLQAYQKYGEKIYQKGLQVRHLNNNKQDNSYSNIALGTNKQNIADRDRDSVIKQALYASSFTKKYDYNKVKYYYNKTRSYKLTMQEFNISSSSALHYILKKGC
jgi:hypothetical protein